MNYIITPDNLKENHAGPKAKEDINKILVNHDFKEIRIPVDLNKFQKIFFAKKVDRMLSNIKMGDTVVIQYPLKSYFITNLILKKAKNKGAKLIGVVHDIESLRQGDKSREPRDINTLMKFDILIVHSPQMKEWLYEHGCNAAMVELGLFDYLVEDTKVGNIDIVPTNDVVFAGNLNKSPFLEKVKMDLDVFGPCNYINKIPKTVKYKGSVDPDVLPTILSKYKYGLVWDGYDTEKISGQMGNYLKFNAPHKASLYLASGIPIIVWGGSALSPIVEKENIGFCINSLSEINRKISENDYETMINNVHDIQKKIINGDFIIQALGGDER